MTLFHLLKLYIVEYHGDIEWRIKNDMKRSGRGQFKVISVHF